MLAFLFGPKKTINPIPAFISAPKKPSKRKPSKTQQLTNLPNEIVDFHYNQKHLIRNARIDMRNKTQLIFVYLSEMDRDNMFIWEKKSFEFRFKLVKQLKTRRS